MELGEEQTAEVSMALIVAKTFKIMGLVEYSTIYTSEEEALTEIVNNRFRKDR
jgi:hypothetical protein